MSSRQKTRAGSGRDALRGGFNSALQLLLFLATCVSVQHALVRPAVLGLLMTPWASTTSASVLRQVHELLAEYNCTSVYFDAGSNIGVQIRKLYEPGWYLDRPDNALNGRAVLQTLYKRSQARIMIKMRRSGKRRGATFAALALSPTRSTNLNCSTSSGRYALQERACLWCTQASPAATAPCSYREWSHVVTAPT